MMSKTDPEIAEARAQGQRDFRERCAAILKSPAARGRYRQAVTLVFDTDMTAEAAVKMLADRPLDPADPINPVPAPGGVFGDKASATDVADAAWARTLGRLQ